jgi:hypothetical protein
MKERISANLEQFTELQAPLATHFERAADIRPKVIEPTTIIDSIEPRASAVDRAAITHEGGLGLGWGGEQPVIIGV